MTRLGILLSGRGSNFLAIADRIRARELLAEIAIVISNREDAPGIAAARDQGLPATVIPSQGTPRTEHDRLMIAALRAAKVNLVCLAGYMRLLSPEFVQAFPQRILNIHPSLLPAFPGLDAQQQALDYGVKITGCTVHFVDNDLDHGPIIVQRPVPVLEGDTVGSLSARILQEEHIAYSEAIAKVIRGEFEINGRCVKVTTPHGRA
jgi:phosphoribosylglycinamide formyltransferase 1